MEYDTDKVDEAVLALLFLTLGANGASNCAWKGHDWDALDRLHDKGLSLTRELLMRSSWHRGLAAVAGAQCWLRAERYCPMLLGKRRFVAAFMLKLIPIPSP